MTRHASPRSSGFGRLRHVIALGISSAALGGLVYIETVAADDSRSDTAEQSDDFDDFDEAESPHFDQPMAEADAISPPAQPPAPTLVAAATTPIAPPVVAVKTAASITPPPVPLMGVMPDVSGMKVPAARRALKALGLRMTVRDSYNDKVDRDIQRYFKVTRQGAEAGTEVEAGSWVRVRVREPIQVAQGY